MKIVHFAPFFIDSRALYTVRGFCWMETIKEAVEVAKLFSTLLVFLRVIRGHYFCILLLVLESRLKIEKTVQWITCVHDYLKGTKYTFFILIFIYYYWAAILKKKLERIKLFFPLKPNNTSSQNSTFFHTLAYTYSVVSGLMRNKSFSLISFTNSLEFTKRTVLILRNRAVLHATTISTFASKLDFRGHSQNHPNNMY